MIVAPCARRVGESGEKARVAVEYAEVAQERGSATTCKLERRARGGDDKGIDDGCGIEYQLNASMPTRAPRGR